MKTLRGKWVAYSRGNMAKRFTDTDKWKRPWWRALPSKAKFTWLYILDNCDHAGIWIADYELASFQLGFKLNEQYLISWLGEKIFKIDEDKIFIPSFIEFQYARLEPKNRAHRSVIDILQKHGIGVNQLGANVPIIAFAERNNKGLISPLDGDKDKDKEKDKDKDKEKEQKRESFDFELVYKIYPRKLGKKSGIKKCSSEIKTKEAFDQLVQAINRFVDYHRKQKTDPKFIPYFSTFMSNWHDWLDPEQGATSLGSVPVSAGLTLGVE